MIPTNRFHNALDASKGFTMGFDKIIHSDKRPGESERRNDAHENDVAMRSMDRRAQRNATEANAAELRSQHIYDNCSKAISEGKRQNEYQNTEDAFLSGQENAYDQTDVPFDGGGSNNSNSGPAARELAESRRLSSSEEISEAMSESSDEMRASPLYEHRVRDRIILAVSGLIGGTFTLGLAGGAVTGLYFLIDMLTSAGDKDANNPAAPTTKPDKPAAPTVTLQGKDAMVITWAKLLGAESFKVLRDGTVIATVLATDSLTYTDTGLDASKKFCYTLVAVNKHGSSDPSEPTCASTPNEEITLPPPVPVLSAPVAVSATGIDVRWAASPGAIHYVLKRRKEGNTGAAETVATLKVGEAADPLSFHDTGLEGATQYCYTIAAGNEAGDSADSDFRCANTFDACRVLADQTVDAWNALPEASYWESITEWIAVDNPSIDCQINVVTYSFQIATKPPAFELQSIGDIQAARNALKATYEAEGTIAMFEEVAVLKVNGQDVTRAEKLRLLGLTLAILRI